MTATFTFTTEDLTSLARGVVPEWLLFDADAALDQQPETSTPDHPKDNP